MTDKKSKEAREQARINKSYKEIISIETDGAGNPYYYGSGTITSQLDRDQRESAKEIERKIAIAAQIKKAEDHGLFSKEKANEERKKAGLSVESSSVPLAGMASSPSYQILLQEIAQEVDPGRRAGLIQALAQIEAAMKATGSAQITIPTIPAARSSDTSDAKDSVFNKLIEKLVDKVTAEPEKYDKVKDFKDMLTALKDYNEMLSPSEGSDDIIENIKKYKEAGFIKDNMTSIEEKKIELEKDKIAHEYEFKKMEIETGSKKIENLTKIATDVAASFVNAASDIKSGKAGATQERSAFATENLNKASSSVDMFTGNCAKCQGAIEVTNIDQSRNIKCPGCGQGYYLDSKQKQLMIVEEQETSSTANETTTVQAPPAPTGTLPKTGTGKK